MKTIVARQEEKQAIDSILYQQKGLDKVSVRHSVVVVATQRFFGFFIRGPY